MNKSTFDKLCLSGTGTEQKSLDLEVENADKIGWESGGQDKVGLHWGRWRVVISRVREVFLVGGKFWRIWSREHGGCR